MMGISRFSGNVHLVLALGREEPRGDAHGDDDDEADEDGVPETGQLATRAGRESCGSVALWDLPLRHLECVCVWKSANGRELESSDGDVVSA